MSSTEETPTEETLDDETPAEIPPADGSVHNRITAIIGELDHIEKDSYFDAGDWGYPFRTVESIKGHLKPLLAKHGVHYNAEKIKIIDGTDLGPNRHRVVLQITWVLHGTDDGNVTTESTPVRHVSMGEAIDTSDKAYAKAQTQAEKYMLIQAFAICDGSSEGEGDHQRPDRSGDAVTTPNSVSGGGEGVWTVNSMKNAVIRTVEITVKRECPDHTFTRDQVREFLAAHWAASGMDNVTPSESSAHRLGGVLSKMAVNQIDEWAGVDIHADETPAAETDETVSEETPDEEPADEVTEPAAEEPAEGNEGPAEPDIESTEDDGIPNEDLPVHPDDLDE